MTFGNRSELLQIVCALIAGGLWPKNNDEWLLRTANRILDDFDEATTKEPAAPPAVRPPEVVADGFVRRIWWRYATEAWWRVGWMNAQSGDFSMDGQNIYIRPSPNSILRLAVHLTSVVVDFDADHIPEPCNIRDIEPVPVPHPHTNEPKGGA